MAEITIVTAFFDIGRKNFSSYSRTNKDYLDYFKSWARIKNNVIIYTERKMAQKVIDIRNSYGLADKTRVVIINNINKLDVEVYEKFRCIENNFYFKNYRFINPACSNKAEYNYIMYLKMYFINEAVQKLSLYGAIAWMDFGFGHGNEVFKNSKDFSYTWDYNFDEKVYLFYKDLLPDVPIFEIIRQQKYEGIMGCLMIFPHKLVGTVWNLYRQATLNCTELGFMDDDQVIWLLAARMRPDLFCLIKSEWFMPLKIFGGIHLQIKLKDQTKLSLPNRIKDKLFFILELLKYLKKVFQVMYNEYIKYKFK